MDPRITARPKVKPKPDTGRPTGIASLAAWLGRLPLPTGKSRQDRREAWLARREARILPSVPLAAPNLAATGAVALPEAPTARRQAPRSAAPAAAARPYLPVMPPPPPDDEWPDLVALVAAANAPAEPLPAWVTAEAPRMVFDMPGPGEAPEGQEFFRLFRQNADGLSELARLAGDAPAGTEAAPAERPWWRFAHR